MSPSQPLPTYCLSCSPSSSFLHSFDPCSGRVAWAPYIWIVNWFPSEVSGYLSRGPLSLGLRRMGQLLVWILSAPTMLTPWLMTESVTETPCDREQHSWDLKQLTHHVTQGPPPPDQGQPFCQWSVPCSNHSRVASLCNLSPLGHRMDRVVICEEFLYLTQDGTQLQSFALDKNSVLMDGYSPNRNNALTENSDFPFWAIILIYLAGLLVLITCLLCGLLVHLSFLPTTDKETEAPTSQPEDESIFYPNEACRMHALQVGVIEKLSESMVPAFLSRIICNITTFVCNYSAFSTFHQVLDQLFTKRVPASSSALW
ncbi:uncharacterized protein [Equus caballus]|uniref:uncharacterized protein n=1 Tax=Equus caballus TaxID=9796 RepID=UPI0038B36839